ncbi:hypothetical protein SAMN02746065_13811 [Desulfocicer vacuolatum DSM 3385]|uniref:Uncharacterized protein n=1 Tax=Desulfocicer vacuolatum DSM 3385 TaxID=1121400 RepID=A0A1W2EPZ8_9BACT|nr:iron-containing alcohol dehydrogenase [Desulfocicer vacuolatum]SMD11789.1 hypothetical protein SAMN02746065_13811 [Desulfocicer vacuolatum DSM 3385]
MGHWFDDPTLRALFPLAQSPGIRGLLTIFNTPKFYIGAHVFPEGPVLGPSTIDAFGRCEKRRAFLVTDEFNEPNCKKITRFLEMHGFTTMVWPGVLPEAPLDSIEAGGDAMKEFEPDLIMAVGGGSVIDTAKMSWVLYEKPELKSISEVNPLLILNLRKKAMLAAVPTTSGTGAECTIAAVAHDTAAHRKLPVANDELVPDVAILTPDFTMSMPPNLTAGTGLDVLAHAADAVTAPSSHEFTEPLALKSIEMVFEWLPLAFRKGDDREARLRMVKAASICGIAFGQSAAHLTHAWGHALGSVFNVHHGVAVGLFIPHSLQFNQKVTDKHLAICKALDIPAPSAEEGLSNLVEAVRKLMISMDLPLTIKDLGISEETFEEKLPQLVELSFGDVCALIGPRPVSASQCEKIMRYAYEGKDIDF